MIFWKMRPYTGLDGIQKFKYSFKCQVCGNLFDTFNLIGATCPDERRK